MNDKQNNETLIDNIQSQLDTSVDGIDAATQSKITQARHRALDQKARSTPFALWIPAGALASVCVALVMLLLVSTSVEKETAPIDDFELISNIDDLELLEELEFYEWLEEYELPT
jgi:hypothetical protein